jgi:chromosome segregation ATPase
LLDAALELHASLERAGAAVAGHQGIVDDLEDRGREFRTTLGRAIDTLSRDRSRERARLDALVERRQRIVATLSAPDLPPSQRESMRSEAAAASSQETSAQGAEADLEFQVATLQRQLNARNEQLERELAEATGKLEGALSAARRITKEIARTRDEAVRLLG